VANSFIAEDCLVTDTLEDGQGLCRVDGKVVFVRGGVPGDKLRLEVYPSGRRQFSGRILEVQSPSLFRREAVCQHFGTCGGCKWQHMSYEAQLQFKSKQVLDAFERIGGIGNPPLKPILGAAAEYNYRNKVEFTFSTRRFRTREELDSGVALTDEVLGFHAPGVFDKILPIETCYLADERINAVRNELLRFSKDKGYSFYDIKQHTGFLRTVVFRTATHTQDWMVLLVTGEMNEDRVAAIFKHLLDTFPFITSLTWAHNPKLNDSYGDLNVHTWYGPGFITEILGGFQFRVSPTSFFQTNTRQAAQLYDVVKGCLSGPVQRLYDLYCGAGSIGVYLSSMAKEVVGIEYVQAAVQDALENVRLNGLQNFRFHSGDIAKILSPGFLDTEGVPDAVVVDPPRAGMDARVVQRLNAMRVPQLVYVSCNPATQARDLALLLEHYTLEGAQPVDMFPQTAHVECVAKLTLRQ